MEGWAVIRVRDDLADVLDRDDVHDARSCACGAHVNRFYFPMCHRAAEDFAVQHSREAHCVGVLRPTRDLVTAFDAWQRTPDLRTYFRHGKGRGRGHECAADCLNAARIVRPT